MHLVDLAVLTELAELEAGLQDLLVFRTVIIGALALGTFQFDHVVLGHIILDFIFSDIFKIFFFRQSTN